MSASTLRLAVLAVVCVAQLACPASMLVSYERTLSRGESFRFECAPVDPVDVFRGRYVALSYPAARLEAGPDMSFGFRERVYVGVERGADGFARLTGPWREPPAEGPYMRTRVRWSNKDTVQLILPFDRYYMTEKLAPAAEEAYRQRVGGEAADTYVTVRVRDGRAVLEELYIGGLPVREYLEREAARSD